MACDRTLGDPIAPGSKGIALHLVGASCHRIGDVVADVLTFPGELADRLTDTAARLLVLLGRLQAKAFRRIGEPLAQL